MWEKIYLVFVVATVVVAMLSIEVDAQSTVDDSASCESSTLDEAVNLIREDLKDVKTACTCASKEQQCSTVNASSLCEYKAHLNAFLVTERMAHLIFRTFHISPYKLFNHKRFNDVSPIKRFTYCLQSVFY